MGLGAARRCGARPALFIAVRIVRKRATLRRQR